MAFTRCFMEHSGSLLADQPVQHEDFRDDDDDVRALTELGQLVSVCGCSFLRPLLKRGQSSEPGGWRTETPKP